jgi:hypothetical protein
VLTRIWASKFTPNRAFDYIEKKKKYFAFLIISLLLTRICAIFKINNQPMIHIFKPFFKKVFSLFIVLFLSFTSVIAQGDGGDDPDIPDIPLDGGLSILLVAGAAYGGKKITDYRNSRKK